MCLYRVSFEYISFKLEVTGNSDKIKTEISTAVAFNTHICHLIGDHLKLHKYFQWGSSLAASLCCKVKADLTICKSRQNFSHGETHLVREKCKRVRRLVRTTDIPKMLIALENVNEACSFLESSFRDANWVTRSRDAPTGDVGLQPRYKYTATILALVEKKKKTDQSARDGNLSYRRRGNDARIMKRASDKNVWKPLDAAGKFNAFNASSSVLTLLLIAT